MEPDQETLSEKVTASILLVEDNATIRRMLTMLLKRDGHTVVAVSGSKDALETLERSAAGTYELLLTDLMMPGMTGSALALEARDRFGIQRVLLMSGYASASDARAQGMPLLAKPFSPVEFITAIQAALTGAPQLA